MIKNIIFDFDGVLVESVGIKTLAFRELFKDLPEKVDEIAKFHIDNGGMSRFDKFRHIYEHILKKPLSSYEFDRLCRAFSNLVVEKVIKAPFVNGALEFLQRNFKKYNIYVVSATPEEELKGIIKRRKMGKYFLGVYGSPMSKEELLLKILKDNDYSAAETVFLGDSINDYLAAQKAGLQFAARVIDDKDDILILKVKKWFKDLFEFERYLEENNPCQG